MNTADLLNRISAAIDTVTENRPRMSIPVNENDVDVVLADCHDEISRLSEENLRLKNSEYVSALVCRRDEEIARLNREAGATLDRLQVAQVELDEWRTALAERVEGGDISPRRMSELFDELSIALATLSADLQGHKHGVAPDITVQRRTDG